jgi:hypothetical protein
MREILRPHVKSNAPLRTIVMLLLAGCAMPVLSYSKPGADRSDFDTAQWNCNLEVQAAVDRRDQLAGIHNLGTIFNPYDSFIDTGMTRRERQQVFVACMERDGWTAREVDRKE